MKAFQVLAAVAAGAALVSGSALAADLPQRSDAPAPYVAPAPVFTWTGFYVGVNAGGAWNQRGSIVPAGNFLLPANAALYPFVTVPTRNGGGAGFTGGVQAGYNWQMNSLVLGVEGDLNYVGGRGKNRGFFRGGIPATPFGFGAPPNTLTYTGGKTNNFLGTARVRAGFAADRALFYVTGGLAFRGSSNGGDVVSFSNSTPAVMATFAGGGNSGSNVGYAVGGGIEYAFSNNWSVKGEYLYAGFGNKTRYLVDPVNAPGFSYAVKNSNNVSLARIGLNYRFGGPSSSVVAKY
ncbi:MAG: outer membrane protein [Beijerinckiaceae bacterium]